MGTPPPIQLATLGMWDTLLLMVLALVVFGPRRLPMIGRQLGKLMYEFRKASNDFKFQMEEELRNAEEADRRRKEEEERQRALAAVPPPPQLEPAVTQAQESTAAAPEPAASGSSRSPYPGETTYPSLVAETARKEDSALPFAETATPPAAEPTTSEADAAALLVKPPSTGQTVAAEDPGKSPENLALGGVAPESVTPEAERSEPAAHHG